MNIQPPEQQAAATFASECADRVRAVDDDPAVQDADTCRAVTIDGKVICVRGTQAMTEEELGSFAEIVRAAQRKYGAEYLETDAS